MWAICLICLIAVLKIFATEVDKQVEKTEIIKNISSTIAEDMVNASKVLVKNPQIDKVTTTEFLKNVSAQAMEKVAPKVKELAQIEASKAIVEAQSTLSKGEKLPLETAKNIFLNATSAIVKQIEAEAKEQSFKKVAEEKEKITLETKPESVVASIKNAENQAVNETLKQTLNVLF